MQTSHSIKLPTKVAQRSFAEHLKYLLSKPKYLGLRGWCDCYVMVPQDLGDQTCWFTYLQDTIYIKGIRDACRAFHLRPFHPMAEYRCTLFDDDFKSYVTFSFRYPDLGYVSW